MIQSFDHKNIPLLVERVKPLWAIEDASETLKQIHVEYIVRHGIFNNEYALQITNGNDFCAAAFAKKLNQKNDCDKWVQEQIAKNILSDKEKHSLKMSTEYCDFMDKQVMSYMTEKDAWLTLFISLKSGYGTKVLEELKARCKKDGFKSLFLWTDCECSFDYYHRNGFTLVKEDVYDKFSQGSQEYKTFIFKTRL